MMRNHRGFRVGRVIAAYSGIAVMGAGNREAPRRIVLIRLKELLRIIRADATVIDYAAEIAEECRFGVGRQGL
jgi:hypothetical protein